MQRLAEFLLLAKPVQRRDNSNRDYQGNVGLFGFFFFGGGVLIIRSLLHQRDVEDFFLLFLWGRRTR